MRTDVIRDIAALPDDRRTKQQVDEALVACATEIDWLRAVLELADAALRGANVNMNVLERKIAKALEGKAEQ
jgi:hypothetical protein